MHCLQAWLSGRVGAAAVSRTFPIFLRMVRKYATGALISVSTARNPSEMVRAIRWVPVVQKNSRLGSSEDLRGPCLYDLPKWPGRGMILRPADAECLPCVKT